MQSEENLTEWIDQYLDNQLTAQQREQFELQLGQDPNLRLEVKAQKITRASLQEQGDQELKAKFRSFHARMDSKKLKSEIGDTNNENTNIGHFWQRVNVLAIAASITVLLVVASVVWLNRQAIFNTSPENVTDKVVFRLPVIDREAKEMGYAGTGLVTDSIIVQLITESSYTHHYRFKDTLQLFSQRIAPDTNNLQLEYNNNSNTYTLIANGQKYQLERGFDRINSLNFK